MGEAGKDETKITLQGAAGAPGAPGEGGGGREAAMRVLERKEMVGKGEEGGGWEGRGMGGGRERANDVRAGGSA
eukprot:761626-Hanusia_phi.AAC.1